MDIFCNEQHDIIRQSVREFAEREIKPLAAELDEKEIFSYELTRRMGELGLFGMTISPDYGGQGMDYLSYIIAVEELARVDSSQAATLAAHNSLGVWSHLIILEPKNKNANTCLNCAPAKLFGVLGLPNRKQEATQGAPAPKLLE